MLVMKGYYRTAAESGVDDDEFYVVVDGSHQRNDWCAESDQGDVVPEAETVGSSQAWNIQRRSGAGEIRFLCLQLNYDDIFEVSVLCDSGTTSPPTSFWTCITRIALAAENAPV